MTAILRLIGSVLVKKLFKRFLEEILSNTKLQTKLFFWLADNMVKRTDTKADDEFLAMVRANVGEEPPESLDDLLKANK